MGTHPIFESDFDCLTDQRMAANRERTFIAIKPDGVQRGLVGKIVKRFEQRGFKLVALKMCAPGRAHMEKHYADLSKKPFFKDLVDYMISGPIVCMVWEGLNAVKCGRMMLGETNPQASLPGSIRGDFSIQVGRNICHGSDSVASANHEIALWFKKEELISWESAMYTWIYEEPVEPPKSSAYAKAPAPVAAEEEEDDDDVDLFGDDDEDDDEAEKIKAARVAEYNAKKAAKEEKKGKWWRSRTSSSTLSRGTTRRTWASWKSSSAPSTWTDSSGARRNSSRLATASRSSRSPP